MENDVIFSKFDDIEKKVEFLIELCKSLEDTNSKLESRVQELERDLQNKIDIEAQHKEQKTIISSKIDSLLSKLSDFSEKS